MTIAALLATSFYSSTLSGTSVVGRCFPTPGSWRVEIYNGRSRLPVRTRISVSEEGPLGAMLDLGKPPPPLRHAAKLAPGSYLSLHSTNPRAGTFALFFGDGDEAPHWDSRKLQAGDRFACLPVRPGLYRIANRLNGSTGQVQVLYPDPRAAEGRPVPPSEPVELSAGATIDPPVVSIDPGNPLVVVARVEAQIELILETPDDGPADLERWRAARIRDRLESVFGPEG